MARGFGVLGILGAVFAILLIGFGVAWLSGRAGAGAAGGSEFSHLRAYKFYFAPVFDFPAQILLRLERPLLKTLVAISVGLLGA